MAAKKYIVKVENNPNFTGIDAGNVAFANGTATISDERMASWFNEHDGYSVEEIVEKPAEEGASEDNAEAPKKGRKSKETE